MKRMGWDDQKRGIQTIDQVHVLSWDRWRGRDRMIRTAIFKHLIKFTYSLETNEEEEKGWWDEKYSKTIDQVHVLSGYRWRGREEWSDEKCSTNLSSSRTNWIRMKRKEWDDQKRDFKTIEQVHTHPGDEWRARDRMIRRDVFKQLTRFTYELETDDEEGIGWIRWEEFKQSTKFTYDLETDEEETDRMRWEVSNNRLT